MGPYVHIVGRATWVCLGRGWVVGDPGRSHSCNIAIVLFFHVGLTVSGTTLQYFVYLSKL